MIELEFQILSERREGLLIEIGHLVVANGFTLQRQRLIKDPHGALLTIVVRGLRRKKRALEAAMEAYDRIISFEVEPYVEGEQRAHFAASRTQSNYVPAPLPDPEPEPPAEAAVVAAPKAAAAPAAVTVPFDQIEPARLTAAPAARPALAPTPPVARARREPELEFILPEPMHAPPAPAPVVEAPFVDLVPLEADEAAVEKVISKLATEYPQIMSRVLKLDQSVAEGARESSLRLAGQRIGSWVFEQEHAQAGNLDLNDAIEQIGVPALGALVKIEQEGSQLHIHHSPLCAEAGHSGCAFFSGFLEGVLGPVLASSELAIFPVCCCSYGADDCVLALSD